MIFKARQSIKMLFFYMSNNDFLFSPLHILNATTFRKNIISLVDILQPVLNEVINNFLPFNLWNLFCTL